MPPEKRCRRAALPLIHQTARGIPRAVNNLALQSLVAAFVEGKGIVDEASAPIGVAEVTRALAGRVGKPSLRSARCRPLRSRRR